LCSIYRYVGRSVWKKYWSKKVIVRIDSINFLFLIFSFCWAKLNHRTLPSPPPQSWKWLSAACAQNLLHALILSCSSSWDSDQFTSVILKMLIFKCNIHTTVIYIQLQFTGFAQRQGKCLLLLNWRIWTYVLLDFVAVTTTSFCLFHKKMKVMATTSFCFKMNQLDRVKKAFAMARCSYMHCRVARFFLVQNAKTGKNIPIGHKIFPMVVK
jgi:hypothetical protein